MEKMLLMISQCGDGYYCYKPNKVCRLSIMVLHYYDIKYKDACENFIQIIT